MKRLLVIIVIILLLTGCRINKEDIRDTYVYTFRLAESHPKDHPTTLADYKFVELVEQKSQGRIQIIVYPAKQLGEEKSVIEQLQFGGIDFARVSIGPLSELIPKLNVIQLPYLYEDSNHMWRVLQSSIGDDLLRSVEEVDLLGLGWMDAGARSFYNSKKAILDIQDFEGLKFRVMQNSMMADMVEALGAEVVELPYGDVYSEIQTGNIDGAENNWPSYDTSKHYEVAAYYSIDEHIRVPEMLLASKLATEVLSEEDFDILYEAAQETEIYQRALWEAMVKDSENKLTKLGININVINNRIKFKEVTLPLYEKYAHDYMDIIKAIGNMKE